MDDDDDDDDDNCVIVNHYGDDICLWLWCDDGGTLLPACISHSTSTMVSHILLALAKCCLKTSQNYIKRYFVFFKIKTSHNPCPVGKFDQFCTFYCEPLATWYTFKYFDAFCEIKISGHFCRFHCERLAFWQVQVSGSSCVAHPRDFYGGFSNLERLCDNKKRIFAAQKWGPTLKTFLSIGPNKTYGLITWLVNSSFPLKAVFSSLRHLTKRLIIIQFSLEFETY